MDPTDVTVVLERLCALLRSDARQRGLPHGLQPVQVEALLYLARCNRYSDTPQAVAEYLGSTKGTVSQTLKVLERIELLVKKPDAADRRVVRIRLTASGRALAAELASPPVLKQAFLVGGFATQSLAVDLNGLLAAMQRVGGHRTFGICNTCRFFQREEDGFRCGLTTEALSSSDSKLICREHERGEVLTEESAAGS